MFNKYFDELEKRLLKSGGVSPRKARSKKTQEPAPSRPADHSELLQALEKIIPAGMQIGRYRIIDKSGYSPEGVDFLIYRDLCRDMSVLMDGYIPSELVYATCFVCPTLNRAGITGVLNRVVQAKKINRYTEEEVENPIIPSFIICYNTDLNLPDIKSQVLDFYMSKSIDSVSEFDIIMILKRGLVIKNWREKRNFIGLETGKDTLMWFFILMSEYLDVEKGRDFDFRSYVKHTEQYNEY